MADIPVKEGADGLKELQEVIKIVGSKAKIIEILENPDLLDEYYDKLFEYYMDDMPYGTAKARDGDPYEWIYKQLDYLIGDNVKEAFDVDSSKLIKLTDKIEQLPPEQKKVYDNLTPGQKQMFHTLVNAIRNPTAVEAKEITEARSLLKTADTTEEKPKTDDEKQTIEKPVEKVNEGSFTKQHYVAIADILKSAKDKNEIINQLADFFKKDNPLFSKEKFVAYLGQTKE